MIKFPEAALVCGTALVITSNTTFGISLIALSIVSAFAKWSVKVHMLRQDQETKTAIMAGISEVVGSLLTSVGTKHATSSRGNGTLH